MATTQRGMLACLTAVLLTACGGASGVRASADRPPADEWVTPENDEVARVLAVALGTPRPTSAASLQRHIASLPAGRSGTVEVLEAVDLEAEELTDPLARMRWRVTTEDADPYTTEEGEQILTCYDVEFSYYGAVDTPVRVPCSMATPALEPPPATGPDPLGDPVEPCRSGSGDCGGGG